MSKFNDILSPMTVNVLVSLAAGTLLGWLLKGKFNRQQALRTAANAAETAGTESCVAGDSGEYKLVLVVRMDLKMGKGKVAAQCSHAAVSCYQQLARRNKDMLREWEGCGQPKVVTKADDVLRSTVSYLERLSLKARELGLVTAIIQDAGRTQIAPGSRTVLGVGPGPAALVDQVTGELKLY